MNSWLPFVIIGLTSGAVYGLAAVGLVLTYKTSGIFNFGYGAIAAVGAFVFYYLYTQHGVPWPIAAAIVVFVVAPLLGLAMEVFGRILAPVPDTLKVVATVGLITSVLALGAIMFGGSDDITFESFLPTSTYQIFGVNVGWDQTITILIALFATIALSYVLRATRLGIAMRGVVDNPELLSITGVKPRRIRRYAWIIGTTFVCICGLLISPGLSVNAQVLTLLVVEAFGAAAFGYFSSLSMAFVGGLILGVAGALCTYWVVNIPALSGLPAGLPFIMLFVVLVVTPKGRLYVHRSITTLPKQTSYYFPTRVRLLAAAVVLVFFVLVPQFVGTYLGVWSQLLTSVILFFSLGVLVRLSGQISLCQYAFAAVGAAGMGHFAGNLHVPWLIALLLSGLIAIPVGAIIAIPAIRLSGIFLALATLGFGILLEQMFYQLAVMFGPTDNGIATPRPDVTIFGWNLGSDTGFYYVLLIAAVLTAVVVLAIHYGRMGRLLRGLGDSPVALETLGARANTTRVMIFCLSAFMAAISGALLASTLEFAYGSAFSSFGSLQLLAVVVIVVIGDPWYAVVAALTTVIPTAYIHLGNIGDYMGLLFGVGAATFAYGYQTGRIATTPRALRRAGDRLNVVLGGRPKADVASGSTSIPRRATSEARPRQVLQSASGTGVLEVRDLTVRYGGVVAVDHVSLTVPSASITGLIGPNGAGKTSTFNACCGLLKPSTGRVLFKDRDISKLGPSGRARLGIGRTFQKVELFNSLTVLENVALGQEAKLAGSDPIRQISGRRGDREVIDVAVREAIELTGIGDLGHLQAGLLPIGQRRLVELARTLAGSFEMLLLDEPSSGLDSNETERFGEIVGHVVRERGVGVLLVEHDMSLVDEVCHRVYVMDFGKLIFEGTVDEMRDSPVVRAAYLGVSSSDVESAGVAVTVVDAE
jgi:ABC-type branched-subunit amino acid transport system ATPase component/branched-subunit amino acid ABC-type transport system permease component